MTTLNATYQSIEVLLSGAVATTEPTIVASYRDGNLLSETGDVSHYSEGEAATSIGSTAGATPVSVVTTPAATRFRTLDEVTIFNADTAQILITVRLKDTSSGTVYKNIRKIYLPAGYTLEYNKFRGWYVVDEYGGYLTSGGGGASVPGGINTEIQFNASGTFDGVTNVTTSGTHITFIETTTAPSAEATGITPFALDFGASNLFLLQQSHGAPKAPMVGWPWSRMSWCGPQAGTTIPQFGASHAQNGTVSHPAQATTNLQTQMSRIRITSAAGAGSNASNRDQARGVWRGNAAGLGGFTVIGTFSSSTAVGNQRAFFGLQSSAAAIGNVNPSTLTQQVGFQYDSAETTWRIGYNDGAGAATRVDLGANFPVDATSVFLMAISCPPNGSAIDYYIKNIGTGNEARGTIAADLPTSTTFLFAQQWLNNGATASAVQLETTGFSLYSDT